MPDVVEVQPSKGNFFLTEADPMSALRTAWKSGKEVVTARLAPTVKAKGIIGRLDPFRKKRYKDARERWQPTHDIQSDLFDSNLKLATSHLRELAISLEAAKDKKRLEVVVEVMTLLKCPEQQAKVLVPETVQKDATLREWLGGADRISSEERRSSADARSPPASAEARSKGGGEESSAGGVVNVSRDASVKSLIVDIAPGITPTDEATVATMLSSGVDDWFSPAFDSNELDRLTQGNALLALGMALHERHGWHSELGVERMTMRAFLSAVQAAYKPVAYHNSRHATDVTHAVHWMMCRLETLRGLSESSSSLFAAVIAAIIHDVGHDGRGNAYHVATWDEKNSAGLALKYSDQSPLERHHCALGFQLMIETGLLSKLPLETRKLVRSRIISMVLATDFGLHGKIMNDFKLMLNTAVPVASSSSSSASSSASSAAAAAAAAAAMGGAVVTGAEPPVRTRRGSGPVFSASSLTMTEAEEVTVASMVIKVADLSYPTKGFEYSLVWIDRCLDEFMEQGDREKERSLPVSYDRQTVNSWKANSQVGFFTYMVKPMYEALDLIADMTPQLGALDKLIGHWKGKIAPKAEESGAADKI